MSFAGEAVSGSPVMSNAAIHSVGSHGLTIPTATGPLDERTRPAGLFSLTPRTVVRRHDDEGAAGAPTSCPAAAGRTHCPRYAAGRSHAGRGARRPYPPALRLRRVIFAAGRCGRASGVRGSGPLHRPPRCDRVSIWTPGMDGCLSTGASSGAGGSSSEGAGGGGGDGGGSALGSACAYPYELLLDDCDPRVVSASTSAMTATAPTTKLPVIGNVAWSLIGVCSSGRLGATTSGLLPPCGPVRAPWLPAPRARCPRLTAARARGRGRRAG